MIENPIPLWTGTEDSRGGPSPRCRL